MFNTVVLSQITCRAIIEVQFFLKGTFIGGMYGQWWAHLLNLGYLLPKDHIQSHLHYTYTRNFVPSFDPSKILLLNQIL